MNNSLATPCKNRLFPLFPTAFLVTTTPAPTIAFMNRAKDMQLIGAELAIIWEDGTEGYISGPALRAASPSAQTAGEHDIFGNKYGGENNADYSNVSITGWVFVGNYAVRFQFSDGHGSGIYSWELLQKLTQ